MTAEKRKEARREVPLKALVIDATGSIICECAMVNVSKGGAKLRLKDVTKVPDHFALLLSKNGKVYRMCDVVRREEQAVGVRFSTPSDEIEVMSYIDAALARLDSTTADPA